MFGYFKLDRECPRAIVRNYRKNYCFLCRALSCHYGFLARFTLSYDIAFLLILVTEDAYLEQASQVQCFNREAGLTAALKDPTARNAAAANILLCAAKLEDDIADENSLTSRLVKMLLSGAIRKAKKDCPEMERIIFSGYSGLRELEKSSAPLEELETAFSDMMVSLARDCLGTCDSVRLKALEAAAKWLYFIDAVDDIDENRQEGAFNPLAHFQSFRNLKEENCLYLSRHYQTLFAQVGAIPGTGLNSRTVHRILYRGIPDTTVRILTKKR